MTDKDSKDEKKKIRLHKSETDAATRMTISSYTVELESPKDSLQRLTDTAFTALKVLEKKDGKQAEDPA